MGQWCSEEEPFPRAISGHEDLNDSPTLVAHLAVSRLRLYDRVLSVNEAVRNSLATADPKYQHSNLELP